MLKDHIIAVIAGLALLVAVAGSTGFAGDAFGLSVTEPAYAYSNGSATGGGC